MAGGGYAARLFFRRFRSGVSTEKKRL